MRTLNCSFYLLILFLFGLSVAHANQTILHPSGLPIPRFVSLKSNEINVRVGPGTRYPIKWVFRKKGYPVEIIEEFAHWRKIRSHDGETGWTHKNLLSGKRTAMVIAQNAMAHVHPDKNANECMQLKERVIATVTECNTEWCHLAINTHEGWVEKNYLWGIYTHEVLEK